MDSHTPIGRTPALRVTMTAPLPHQSLPLHPQTCSTYTTSARLADAKESDYCVGTHINVDMSALSGDICAGSTAPLSISQGKHLMGRSTACSTMLLSCVSMHAFQIRLIEA